MSQTQNLFSFVSTLSGVQRFSLIKQVHAENVLEHTGMVAIFAMTIVSQINERTIMRRNEDKELEGAMKELIPIAAVLTNAIIHDFDETVTGDVVRPTKYFSKELRDGFHALEMDGIAKIADKLQLAFLSDRHARAKDGIVGYIVAFADLMAAVHRVWEEVLVNHNHHMVPCAHGMRKFLMKIIANRPASHFQFHKVLDEYSRELGDILDRVCAIKSEFVEMV